MAPGERLEQQELAALIREAVEGLPATNREAICLYYYKGYDVADAARFLGVPVGTLKRRLHDGRRRLHAVIERILEGSKPMDPERKQLVQELQKAAAEGLDSEAFYQVMRKALSLRPVPRELLKEFRDRHLESIRKRGGNPMLSPEQEQTIRESLSQVHEPSERANDPNHPVGAAAGVIRAALRMQLGDDPIPAAVGGVLNRWSILPEGVVVALVEIHLEPWASIRSGQRIELAKGTPFPSLNRASPEP